MDQSLLQFLGKPFSLPSIFMFLGTLISNLTLKNSNSKKLTARAMWKFWILPNFYTILHLTHTWWSKMVKMDRGCMQEFIARLLVPRSTLNHVSSLTYDVIFEPLQSPAARKFDMVFLSFLRKFVRKWIDCYYNFWQAILLAIHFYVNWDADFEFDIKNRIRKKYCTCNLKNFEFWTFWTFFAFLRRRDDGNC